MRAMQRAHGGRKAHVERAGQPARRRGHPRRADDADRWPAGRCAVARLRARCFAAQHLQFGLPVGDHTRFAPTRHFGNECRIAGSEILRAVVALPRPAGIVATAGAHATTGAAAFLENDDLMPDSLQSGCASKARQASTHYRDMAARIDGARFA